MNSGQHLRQRAARDWDSHMRPHEIESWVLSIVDRVRSKQPIEDFRVELKRQWPTDHAKAARRLAGHCNAARGEPALWVIGLDEDQGVIGADRTELREWQQQVERHFDSLAPELLRDINVSVDDKTVVALLFATDRAPFVVKNPEHGQSGGGAVETEVPWRDATAVRSARREDLIRLLTPIQRLPAIEVLDASLGCSQWQKDGPASGLRWSFRAELYVVAPSHERVVLPFHRCTVRLSIEPYVRALELQDIALHPLMDSARQVVTSFEDANTPPDVLSKTVDSSPTEVLINAAGFVVCTASIKADFVDDRAFQEPAKYSVSIRPAGTERSISLAGELQPPRDLPGPQKSVDWESAK